MNFAELRFWMLLGWGLLMILGLRLIVPERWRGRYDRGMLAVLGLSMLGAVGVLTCVVYLGVLLVTHFGLRWILADAVRRRGWAVPLVGLQLAPLLYYKYGHFLTEEVLGREGWVVADLLIPVGISFYTFQMVGFVVDTLHRGQSLPGLLDTLNFSGFFPQLVAGPIERREDLLPQMEVFRFRWDVGMVADGVSWVVLGLFFKLCLADNLAMFLQRDTGPNAYLIWTNNLLFALRIYFDFAGYSLVALGLARCLGLRLTLNFASPYLAASPSEFWRRWHVTLSQWFRDYLYIPLGGNRVKRWAFNILVVFVASGLWHGAGWNFMGWGLFHGLLLVLAANGWPRGTRWLWLGHLLTVVAVLFSWLLFYETRTPVLLSAMRTLVSPSGYSARALAEWLAWGKSANGVVAMAFIGLAGAIFLMEWRSLRAGGIAYSEFRRLWMQVILIVLTVWLAPGASNGFIYFAF